MARSHFAGSFPVERSEEVFHAVAEHLSDDEVTRLPDGETGDRKGWFVHQFRNLCATDGIEVGDAKHVEGARSFPQLRLTKPVSELRFAPLGYRDHARSTYGEFEGARVDGVVASHVRYQACFPTPIAVVGAFVPADDQASFEPRYEEAVVGEVQAICNDIPHQDLAVQWDVAVETAMLEGAMEHWFRDDTVFDELIARLVRLGNAIPGDVQLGYHLCYGYYERKHFLEPKDLGLLTRMANAIQAGLDRRLDFVQMPVPVSRDDEEYFAPLAGLDLDGELYLGVVHHDDGVAGAERRIAAAKAVVGDRLTGVATECGMGQYPPEWLGKLLEIHAEVRV